MQNTSTCLLNINVIKFSIQKAVDTHFSFVLFYCWGIILLLVTIIQIYYSYLGPLSRSALDLWSGLSQICEENVKKFSRVSFCRSFINFLIIIIRYIHQKNFKTINLYIIGIIGLKLKATNVICLL